MRLRHLVSLLAACSLTATGVSAAPAAAPAGKPDIIVGQVVDLTGSDGHSGNEYVIGAKAYFDEVNANGGVFGRQIKQVVIDSKGSAPKAFQATQQLIDTDKADVLFGYTGTAAVSLVVRSKLLQKNNIALVAPLTGADALRATASDAAMPDSEGFVPQLFHLRASYSQEARKLVKQAINLGMKKIAVFYADDAFGKGGLKAVEAELAKRNMTLVAKSAYDPRKLDVSEPVLMLSRAQPQAVIMVSETLATANFVKQFRGKMTGTQLMGLSVVNPKVLIREAGIENVQGIGLTVVVPNPYNPVTIIAREHKEMVTPYQNQAELSYNTMEGYLAAKLLVEGLNRAGAQMNREKIQRALESMGSVSLGGYEINYSPTDHRGSSYVDMAVVNKDGKLLN